MAARYSCDGCGCNLEKPRVVGAVLKRDYCEECEKNARMFLKAEEENRAHYRQRFAEVRQQLIKFHGKEGKFLLPDVP